MKNIHFFLLLLLFAAGVAASWYGFNLAAPKIENFFGYQPQNEETEEEKTTPPAPGAGRWDQKTLKQQYRLHRAGFPEFKTMQEYGNAAVEFFKNPPEGTEFKLGQDGDRLSYHEKSNTFGATDRKGIPKTFSRPKEGKDFWARQ